MKKRFKKLSNPFLLLVAIIIFLSSFINFFLWTKESIFAYLLVVIVAVLSSASIISLYTFIGPSIVNENSLLRRLVRFESLSHPLLLRLSYEAPGTFHHSINVSILAQQAAASINANALLVRVGAYYHDIGKLVEPINFIENQSGEEIPKSEDVESIKKNVQTIISHVKNGLEIASKNNLPIEITNLIAEHHGTTKVLYFYEKAKEKKLKIKKTDFKYLGPTPKSKEAAILMLADSVEAAARAITDLTKEKIEEIVINTLEDKLSENQFKRAGLTENNLTTIKNSLVKTLLSIYHQRLLSRGNSNTTLNV